MQEEDKMVVAGKKVLVFGSGISGIGSVKKIRHILFHYRLVSIYLLKKYYLTVIKKQMIFILKFLKMEKYL